MYVYLESSGVESLRSLCAYFLKKKKKSELALSLRINLKNKEKGLKFDSPLPEDHRVNTLSTANSLRHH